MKNIFTFYLLLLGSMVLSSCDYELEGVDFYEPKTLISGYVPAFDSPSVVRIQKSVPLNSATKYEPVKNAIITLFEQDEQGNRKSFPYKLQGEEYVTTEKTITKARHNYWIEVVIGTKTYKSRAVKAVNFNTTQTLSKTNDTTALLVARGNCSMFLAQETGNFNEAKAASGYGGFQDIKYRSGYPAYTYLNTKNKQSHWIYVVEIPEDLDPFYRQWNNGLSSLSGTPESTPGANPRSLFTENGQVPTDILGGFFPCFGHKIITPK